MNSLPQTDAAEQPFFFGNEGEALFGVLHQPSTPSDQAAFVMCHPFGEEKLWAHRVFVTFARALAKRGHAVLRFDLRGNGDSSGDFTASSIDTCLEDVATAIDTLKAITSSGQVCLIGLRFGALLAAITAMRRPDVRSLVLWSPIVDGNAYLQELLRINLATQMAVYREIRFDRSQLIDQMRAGGPVNVDGYLLGWPLYEQLSKIKLDAAGEFAGPSLIVQIERRQSPVVSPDLERLRRNLNAKLIDVQEDPFWKEIPKYYDEAPSLFGRTLEWLENHGGPVSERTQRL